MDNQGLQESLNPLLLPSVVTVLVEHLHSQDVVSCRQVCRLWNSTIRKKCPLLNPRIVSTLVEHISDESILKFRLVCSLWNHVVVKSPRWNNITNLEACMWSTLFTKYHVRFEDLQRFSSKFGDPDLLSLPLAFTHFTAPNNFSLSDPRTRDFLGTYGKFLKSLEVYRCNWGLDDLRHILYRCAVNLESFKVVCGVLPGTLVRKGMKIIIVELDCVLREDPSDFPVLDKLKVFHVDMNILDGKNCARPYVEQFLTEFFDSTQNLEVINFDFSSWHARTWATNFIASSEHVGLKKLRVLEHLIDPDLNAVVNLTNKQFPLTKLRIRIRYKDVTPEALHNLLRSLSSTLTDLQLVFIEYKCAHVFPSTLEKLKKFELWRFKGQLGFLRDFPSLEELVLGEVELKGQEVFCMRSDFGKILKNVRVRFKDQWEVRVFS